MAEVNPLKVWAKAWRESPNAEGLWVEYDPTKPPGESHYEVAWYHASEVWAEREDGDESWYLAIPIASQRLA